MRRARDSPHDHRSRDEPTLDDVWHHARVASKWGMTPRQSIEAMCARRGRDDVIAGCVGLLEGRTLDDELILTLGGPHARRVLDGFEGGREGCWPRVWAVRGLLHVFDAVAKDPVIRAGPDDSWRVREMVAKVVAAHRVDEAAEAVAGLLDDPVARIRCAAERALSRLVD